MVYGRGSVRQTIGRKGVRDAPTEESDVLDFCKLGCTSSVCSTINIFAVNEEGNGAVDSCNNARYRFCSKEAEVVTVAS
uniref:Uncharacterized protein n=1 Tax=Oryza sativa subsp. japonica TaxID=39947 RepID=Q5Z557_ORYSJ|nr:hypothetical protein [Oryza sativa Japonica Group]